MLIAIAIVVGVLLYIGIALTSLKISYKIKMDSRARAGEKDYFTPDMVQFYRWAAWCWPVSLAVMILLVVVCIVGFPIAKYVDWLGSKELGSKEAAEKLNLITADRLRK